MHQLEQQHQLVYRLLALSRQYLKQYLKQRQYLKLEILGTDREEQQIVLFRSVVYDGFDHHQFSCCHP